MSFLFALYHPQNRTTLDGPVLVSKFHPHNKVYKPQKPALAFDYIPLQMFELLTKPTENSKILGSLTRLHSRVSTLLGLVLWDRRVPRVLPQTPYLEGSGDLVSSYSLSSNQSGSVLGLLITYLLSPPTLQVTLTAQAFHRTRMKTPPTAPNVQSFHEAHHQPGSLIPTASTSKKTYRNC